MHSNPTSDFSSDPVSIVWTLLCFPSSSFSTLQLGCQGAGNLPFSYRTWWRGCTLYRGTHLSCIRDWMGLGLSSWQGLHPAAAGDHVGRLGEAAPYPYYLFSSSPPSQQAENPQPRNPGPWSLHRGTCHTNLWLYLREKYLNLKCQPRHYLGS